MKISDFIAAFRSGSELANAATWKNRTLAANSIVALLSALLAIAAALGYRLDVTREELEALAAGLAALVAIGNSIMHILTSTRVGLPSPK